MTAGIQDYEKQYRQLVQGGQLLIEEPIRQHPDMCKLCPDSVNTVRIVTLVTEQGAQMVYALVRMGMGGVCVDNVSSGGMYAPVNEQGQLYRPAFCDKTGKYYDRHPVTGTDIVGFQIPLFDQALALCRTASKRVEAHLKYIGWDVDDTLDTTMVINACKKAFKVAKPLIINSDQGSQFTSDKYIDFIRDNGIRQSMDGKSRWADNIMIERWFRSFKYEEAYLTEYANLKEAREAIGKYIRTYNFERCHQAIGNKRPAEVYYPAMLLDAARAAA